MKEIVTVVRSWCDYPDCADEETMPKGQETSTVQYWVYVNAKGRKTQPITVELCQTHRDLLKGIFQSMQRFDQRTD